MKTRERRKSGTFHPHRGNYNSSPIEIFPCCQVGLLTSPQTLTFPTSMPLPKQNSPIFIKINSFSENASENLSRLSKLT